MFYVYQTLSGLDQYLKPSYRYGAFHANDASTVGKILQDRLGRAIRYRTLTVYFFKDVVKHQEKIATYALRYDPPIHSKKVKSKSIRGFVDVKQVSFLQYSKVKLQHFWTYWIKDNTPSEDISIFEHQ